MEIKQYDYLVIGGGSGGLASVKRAALLGKQCAIIEKKKLGGTCVHLGCVPKKVMWYGVELAQSITQIAPHYGMNSSGFSVNWNALITARERYIDKIQAYYRQELIKNRIDYYEGSAVFIGPRLVQVDNCYLSAEHILIATGSQPRWPKLPGAELGIDSNAFFALQDLPQRVAVVGAGYIAVELSGILSGLGTTVDWLYRYESPLRQLDDFIRKALLNNLADSDIRLHPYSKLTSISQQKNGSIVIHRDGKSQLEVDCLIWAVGRDPNTRTLCLNQTGVNCDSRGYIEVDTHQNTSYSGIYAVGDVTKGSALTPVATAAGRRLSERIFLNKPSSYLDIKTACIPTVIFSHPPIGTVGFTEAEAVQHYGASMVSTYQSSFTPMLLALTDKPQRTHMKLVCIRTHSSTEQIIGLHGIGLGMDEILQGFAVAVKLGATKEDFDQAIAIHPTSGEEFLCMR